MATDTTLACPAEVSSFTGDSRRSTGGRSKASFRVMTGSPIPESDTAPLEPLYVPTRRLPRGAILNQLGGSPPLPSGSPLGSGGSPPSSGSLLNPGGSPPTPGSSLLGSRGSPLPSGNLLPNPVGSLTGRRGSPLPFGGSPPSSSQPRGSLLLQSFKPRGTPLWERLVPPSAPPEKPILDPTEGDPPRSRSNYRHPMSLHLSQDKIDNDLTPSVPPSVEQPTLYDAITIANPPSSIAFHLDATPTDELSIPFEVMDPGLDYAPAPWPAVESSWFQSLQRALQWSPPPLIPSFFRFELTDDAANHNLAVLSANNMDLRHLLFSNKDLPTCPGSNFRPIELLDPLFHGHPRWLRVRQTLTTGASFPLYPIDEATRKEELDAIIEYGNHKSATKERAAVLETLQEETAKGWHLPLPVDALHQLANVAAAPFGYVKQLKLQADGSRKEAGRITHDQTFCQRHAGTSVNKRVREDELPPVFYGFALQRLLNRLIATRLIYIQLPIYLPKYDWKSAYKNCHFGLETLVQAATTTKGITTDSTLALLALRMTFGGSPCPTIFSDLSETVTDAANHLVRDQSWDPALVQSQFIAHIDTNPVVYSDASTPFAIARQTTVKHLIPVDGLPFFDVFLDDHLGLIVHTSDDAVLRGAHAIPLMLDVMGRPLRADEPLPRNALIAVSKLIAEGCLTETQVILGWEVDSRTLIIRLPQDKYRIYSEDIQLLLDRQGYSVAAAILATLYGRLVHVAVVVTEMRPFLGRIHSAKSRAEATTGKHRKSTRLTRAERQDLTECLRFLSVARDGIDINLLVPRYPDLIVPTDACLAQVGGHDMPGGFGWRLPVPQGSPAHHINFLEFLGPVCGIWLAVAEGRLKRGDCVLAIGDNTTAAGWMRRSNFSDETSTPQTLLLARLLSAICSHQGICFYSQWKMGLDNVVPDLISRDTSSSDESLTQLILSSSLALQVPASFTMRPLPNKILSALSSLMHLNPSLLESHAPLMFEKTWLGNAGCSSLNELVSSTIHSSSTARQRTERISLSPLFNPSVEATIQSQLKDQVPWWPDLSLPPSEVWLRPLRPLVIPIPVTTRKERLSQC
ncbi:hypothetical protein MPSEU_000318900 [Mayamaea pseudoterrestris]|nr:hypothetical protein MPSEU_000318900 [Mayamaea pseudoterrestris]